MKKTRFIMLFFLSISLLAGCGQHVSEEIYETLEFVVQLEEGFEKQQQPLIQLEEREKAIYEAILELGLKEREQIIERIDEAIKIADERQKHLDLEKESIQKAKNEFQKVEKLIGEITEPKLKESATNLYQLMNERYETHEKLYEQYSLGIKYDKELYELLKHENVSLDDLQEKIAKINQVYEEVYGLNETFNQKTNDYNEAKLLFYKKAGLNIKE